MHYVYALKSKVNNNWLYVGRTDDLRNRFRLHNLGKVKSTKAYKPFVLVYYEAYLSKRDATKREFELKKHSHKDNLKIKIQNSLNNIDI